jgi:hypothetical protein
VPPTRVRAAHAAALSASLAALALALRDVPFVMPVLLGLALGVLAVPWVEWTPTLPALARGLPRAFGLVALVLAAVAWLSRSLGLLVLEPTVVPLMAGPLLVPPAIAFALAPRAFPAGSTLVPAIVYLLGLAGLNPSPAGYGPTVLPFLRRGEHNAFAEAYLALGAVVLFALWAAALVGSGPRWRTRDAAAVGLAATMAAALAATGVVGLPLLQPRVEQAFASALDAGETGLTNESTLGEFAELAVSRRRVLDLRSSRPDAFPWLLRSEVFTRFDGRRWTNARPAAGKGRGKPPTEVLRPGPAPPWSGRSSATSAPGSRRPRPRPPRRRPRRAWTSSSTSAKSAGGPSSSRGGPRW